MSRIWKNKKKIEAKKWRHYRSSNSLCIQIRYNSNTVIFDIAVIPHPTIAFKSPALGFGDPKAKRSLNFESENLQTGATTISTLKFETSAAEAGQGGEVDFEDLNMVVNNSISTPVSSTNR